MTSLKRSIISFSGFTLIELLSTLTIGAVLVTLSTPVANMVRSSQASSLTHEFVASLNFARAEAIKRGNKVTVCRTLHGDQCEGNPDINKQKDWSSGWMVFADINGDGDYDEQQDELLRLHDRLPDGYTLRSNSRVRVTYNALGISPGYMDSWTLCAPGSNPAHSKGVVIAYTGRVRYARDSNGDGSIDNGTASMKGKPRELLCSQS